MPVTGSMPPQLEAQLTSMFAVKIWVCPGGVVAVAGVITMGDVTDAVAFAACPPLAGVAVMVQDPAVRGAVYAPMLGSMEPHEADQVAGALAVNC